MLAFLLLPLDWLPLFALESVGRSVGVFAAIKSESRKMRISQFRRPDTERGQHIIAIRSFDLKIIPLNKSRAAALRSTYHIFFFLSPFFLFHSNSYWIWCDIIETLHFINRNASTQTQQSTSKCDNHRLYGNMRAKIDKKNGIFEWLLHEILRLMIMLYIIILLWNVFFVESTAFLDNRNANLFAANSSVFRWISTNVLEYHCFNLRVHGKQREL